MTDNCKRLEGKVAFITGGASGIGKGIAKRFLEEGAKVVIADFNEETLEATKGELGANCAGVFANVTVEADLERAVAFTVEQFGHLDIGVNSAGIGTLSPIVDHDEEQWDAVVGVCLKGTFLSMKHEGRQMIAQGNGGAIVNIASLNSRQPAEGMAAYCSSKAAIEMLTKVGAMEMGPKKIRVNAISPGLIDTPMTAPMIGMPAVCDEFVANAPLGRYGTVDDIAYAALFLASDESSWVTGDTLFVDGGALTKRYPEILKAFGMA